MNRNFLLIVILITVLLSSCKRDNFYSCLCNTKNGGVYPNPSVESYKLGRMPKEQAYDMCRAKVGGNNEDCYMAVSK